MVDVVHEPINDKQAEMHTWPTADYCGFGLEHVIPIHLIFGPCPLNANVVQLLEWSQFITFASSRVQCRG